MSLPFDSIIACGDSYTEGCKDILSIGQEQTWPGQVAGYFSVPFVNLARGGSSNYEIALQPVQALEQNTWDFEPQRPLMIFTFTIDYRMPYYDFDLGRIHSVFTIDPKVLDRVGSTRIRNLRSIMPYLRTGTELCDGTYDGYQLQTQSAIRVANRYKTLIPHAQIIWGFGHCNCSDIPYDQRFIDDQLQQQWYPHLDSCYNEDLPLRRPLQWFSNRDQFWISSKDIHPDRRGIDAYAQAMIAVIKRRFSL
jgi:hypothetical protein